MQLGECREEKAPREDGLDALPFDVCVQRRSHGGLRRPPLALNVLTLQRQPASAGISSPKPPWSLHHAKAVSMQPRVLHRHRLEAAAMPGDLSAISSPVRGLLPHALLMLCAAAVLGAAVAR